MSVLGAASYALLRKRIPGAPCVETDDGCPAEVSRFREAWMILREGLRSVRSTASEGVAALSAELKLSSAAFGVPGLVGFQYLVDKLTPLRFADELETALVDSLVDVRIGSRKLELRRFSVGDKPPQLVAARVYDVGADALGFDLDCVWESELEARLEAVPDKLLGGGGVDADGSGSPVPGLTGENQQGFNAALASARVPVSISNFRFVGSVRVVVTHLTRESPGYGAVLLSLPSPPEIGLDVRVAGADVTKVPFFRDELERALQATIADQLYWPRRVVIPTDQPGAVGVPVLPAETLRQLEYEDPLLKAEQQQLAEQPAIGAFQEDLAEVQSRSLNAKEASTFDINLGVLPDFTNQNIIYAISNLTGVEFRSELLGELADSLLGDNFGSFADSLGNFTDFTDLESTLATLPRDFGELGEQLQRELQSRAAADLGELERSLLAEIDSQRKRFGANTSEVDEESQGSWWAAAGGAVVGAAGYVRRGIASIGTSSSRNSSSSSSSNSSSGVGISGEKQNANESAEGGAAAAAAVVAAAAAAAAGNKSREAWWQLWRAVEEQPVKTKEDDGGAAAALLQVGNATATAAPRSPSSLPAPPAPANRFAQLGWSVESIAPVRLPAKNESRRITVTTTTTDSLSNSTALAGSTNSTAVAVEQPSGGSGTSSVTPTAKRAERELS